MVTPQPRPKEAKKEPSRAPTRTTGSEHDIRPTYLQRDFCKHTEGIIDTKVETTVDNDTNDWGNETTIEAGKAIRR